MSDADEARGRADYCYGTSCKETGSGADDLELGVVQFRGCRPKLRDPRSKPPAASKGPCVRAPGAAVKIFLAPLDFLYVTRFLSLVVAHNRTHYSLVAQGRVARRLITLQSASRFSTATFFFYPQT